MSRNRALLAGEITLAVMAFAYVLIVNGAIPGVTTPSLGLALWTSSFAQSFANVSPLAVHASNFGYPGTPAMAFGLSGAVVDAWLIRAGVDAPDAYTTMVALWLAVSFAGAYLLARRLEARRIVSVLAAALWLSSPIVWGHAGFGALSLGIALLPAYFLPLIILLDKPDPRTIVASFLLAVISVFMDGYSFMMFATGALLLCAGVFITGCRSRRYLVVVPVFVQVTSLGLAYMLYRMYSQYDKYDVPPLNFFRAWGLDLSFIVVPTAGVHWLWDLLETAKERSDVWYYGDGSVWGTTFCLPLIIIGLYGAWRAPRRKLGVAVILVACFGFYMSLGPSLKLDTVRPRTSEGTAALAPTGDPWLMPREMGVLSTGSAAISSKVPGFKLMRASYRWAALGLFACWLLFLLGTTGEPNRYTPAIMLVVVICMLAPHPVNAYQQSSLHRRLMSDIERDVVAPLGKLVRGPVIAFAPLGNDFLGAYIAARLNLNAFNAGGDKNYAMAYAQWPSDVLRLRDPGVPGQDIGIVRFLLHGTGDSVVIPYFDLFQSAQIWPCNPAGMNAHISPAFQEPPSDGDCVSAFRRYYAPTVRALKAKPYLKVVDTKWFAVVTLDDAHRTVGERKALLQRLAADIDYPIIIASETAAGTASQDIVLNRGWHLREPGLVWSEASSVIELPVPDDCEASRCSATLTFGVFGASPNRPMAVHISEIADSDVWHMSITVHDGSPIQASVPLMAGAATRRFRIDVPDATTPANLTSSGDSRRLGIGLTRIDAARGAE